MAEVVKRQYRHESHCGEEARQQPLARMLRAQAEPEDHSASHRSADGARYVDYARLHGPDQRNEIDGNPAVIRVAAHSRLDTRVRASRRWKSTVKAAITANKSKASRAQIDDANSNWTGISGARPKALRRRAESRWRSRLGRHRSRSALQTVRVHQGRSPTEREGLARLRQAPSTVS